MDWNNLISLPFRLLDLTFCHEIFENCHKWYIESSFGGVVNVRYLACGSNLVYLKSFPAEGIFVWLMRLPGRLVGHPPRLSDGEVTHHSLPTLPSSPWAIWSCWRLVEETEGINFRDHCTEGKPYVQRWWLPPNTLCYLIGGVRVINWTIWIQRTNYSTAPQSTIEL